MKKIIKITICLGIIILVVTKCEFESTNDKLKYYLNNKIGISDYQIDKPKKKKGEDGTKDTYWPVNYKDITFYLINDQYYRQGFITSYLTSNFDSMVIEYYYNKYPRHDNFMLKTIDSDYKYLTCDVTTEDNYISEENIKNCYDDAYGLIKSIDYDNYPVYKIYLEYTKGEDFLTSFVLYEKNNRVLDYIDVYQKIYPYIIEDYCNVTCQDGKFCFNSCKSILNYYDGRYKFDDLIIEGYCNALHRGNENLIGLCVIGYKNILDKGLFIIDY